MSNVSIRRTGGRAGLLALTLLIVASFGVDVIIDNADACSIATFPAICFNPQSTDEASEPPTRPDLLTARYKRGRSPDGCFAGDCAGSDDSLKLAVADLTYDDVDNLDMMGVIVRAESRSDAAERFLDNLRPSHGRSCANDGAFYSNTLRSFQSDIVEGEVLIRYDVDPQRYSTLGDIDVSIAFVDQSGNIGPFSNPVRLVLWPSFG